MRYTMCDIRCARYPHRLLYHHVLEFTERTRKFLQASEPVTQCLRVRFSGHQLGTREQQVATAVNYKAEGGFVQKQPTSRARGLTCSKSDEYIFSEGKGGTVLNLSDSANL